MRKCGSITKITFPMGQHLRVGGPNLTSSFHIQVPNILRLGEAQGHLTHPLHSTTHSTSIFQTRKHPYEDLWTRKKEKENKQTKLICRNVISSPKLHFHSFFYFDFCSFVLFLFFFLVYMMISKGQHLRAGGPNQASSLHIGTKYTNRSGCSRDSMHCLPSTTHSTSSFQMEKKTLWGAY